MHRALPPFMMGVVVALAACVAISWIGGGFPPSTSFEAADITHTENDVGGAGIQVRVTEMPADRLTKDAVFMGTMTFAGLALFSSSLLTRVYGITKSSPREHRIAAFLILLGSFVLVTLQLSLAARMCCEDPKSIVWGFVAASFAFALLVAASHLYLVFAGPSNTPEQG